MRDTTNSSLRASEASVAIQAASMPREGVDNPHAALDRHGASPLAMTVEGASPLAMTSFQRERYRVGPSKL